MLFTLCEPKTLVEALLARRSPQHNGFWRAGPIPGALYRKVIQILYKAHPDAPLRQGGTLGWDTALEELENLERRLDARGALPLDDGVEGHLWVEPTKPVKAEENKENDADFMNQYVEWQTKAAMDAITMPPPRIPEHKRQHRYENPYLMEYY